MLVDRVLPPEEWGRLDGELAPMVPFFDPARVKIVVVEDDGVIVAHGVCYTVDHVDGVWIAPSHRGNTAVTRRGWRIINETLRASGATEMMVTAFCQEMADLFEKRGKVFPGLPFVLKVE